MNRRGFLAGLLGAAVAPAAPKVHLLGTTGLSGLAKLRVTYGTARGFPISPVTNYGGGIYEWLSPSGGDRPQ